MWRLCIICRFYYNFCIRTLRNLEYLNGNPVVSSRIWTLNLWLVTFVFYIFSFFWGSQWYTSTEDLYLKSPKIMFFCRVNPKWVIYNSLVSTDRQYMHNVITIDPSWLLEAAPHFYQQQQSNPPLRWLALGLLTVTVYEAKERNC